MNTKTDNQRAKLPKKLYMATDGSLKLCVTGPLMELPIDFQAWPRTDTANIVLFVRKAA
ncbi:hypothetical protein [Methylomonas albis]|uniref:Uncharacterized protein n=1 Tax=Methylomonas albis TaxID=1854563 RepID=A0ABR9D1N0_9GAMM|nr:hypothetical protein [Methylomonas albis]MBD9357031.1 hypothetical protein [Methylomonas albis]